MTNVITMASRCAAPTTAANCAAFNTTRTDAVILHMQAVNGLTQALHTLHCTDLSPTDLHRAIGRAMRGTTAIKRLAAMGVLEVTA